ncbi:MAG: Uncharacterised protein [Acidimicrobiaceae bacterium]|nr:MAG: Uncharacterised protein [Acidimicrobiaceae bacterium]
MLKKFLFTFLVAGILFFSSSTALSESSGELTLVGQSPWVTNDEIVFDLRVSGFDDNGFFKITAHEAIDRSNLIALKTGDLPPSIGTAITIPLTEKLNSSGLASLRISISPNQELNPDFVLNPEMVYPFTIELITDTGTIIDQIATPVIFPSENDPTPLATTLSLIISGPPPLQSDGTLVFHEESLESLDIVSKAINAHPEIPVGLELPPSIVVELSRSNDLSHTELVESLSQFLTANVEIFSSPFVSADPEAWRNTGKTEIYSDLLNHGDIVLEDRIGVTPNRSTTFLSSTAKGETIQLLNQLGTEYFLVEADYLVPQPSSEVFNTNSIIKILDHNENPYPGLIIDHQLNNHLPNSEDPILGIQFLFADLALISWSIPENAVAPLIIKNPFPKELFLINVLFELLDEAPFLEVTHLSDVLSHPLEDAPSFNLWPQEFSQITERAFNYELMMNVLGAYYSILGISHPDITSLASLAENSAAAELSNDESGLYLGNFYTSIANVSEHFNAPEEQSVRLTSRQAEVPFVIENGLDIPANISIHLKSDSRIHFPDGNIVNTTLLPGSNRISLMVEARASGDSQIEVTVYSPDENNLIALESGRILIRTTKLSGVGVFLLIIALGVLIFWWIKSNRARKTT